MSKGFDRTVGYGKPPIHTQFSSTRQPPRRPKVLPPRENTTVIELAKQPVRVIQADGSATYIDGAAAIRERLINDAFGGKVAALRDVYRKLDEEDAAWRAQPRHKISRRQKMKMRDETMLLLTAMREELTRLLELGLIEHVWERDYRIAPWVRQAYERKQLQAVVRMKMTR